MRLKAGYGFWDLRDCPIGGSFHRAGHLGIEIDSDSLQIFEKSYYGSNAKGIRLDTGTEIAFHTDHLED